MNVSATPGDPEPLHAAAVSPFTDATATPDLRVAEHFLTRLDDSAESFTFQTFDDAPAQRPGLARVLHGTIEKLGPVLTSLNDTGAGVFVMVNVGDERGRKTENVTGVRAVFADFDGTPLPQVWPLEPNIVVESSTGRFHAYWSARNVELGEFKRLQEAIAARFGSDPTVCDLPRVMRVPGFIHRKGVPFRSRIVHECPAQPYTRDPLVSALGLRVNGHDHAAHNEDGAPAQEQGNRSSDRNIPRGQRNAHLSRLAYALRKKGFSVEAIEVALLEENRVRCDPPLGEPEMRAIARGKAGINPDESVHGDLRLKCNRFGQPLPNLANVVKVLTRHAARRGRIYYDEFFGRIYTTESVGPPREWSDRDDIRVAFWLQSVIGTDRVSVATVADAVRHVAMLDRRDEVITDLELLRWDGQSRLPMLIARGFGANANDYHAQVGANFLIGMAARACARAARWTRCRSLRGHRARSNLPPSPSSAASGSLKYINRSTARTSISHWRASSCLRSARCIRLRKPRSNA